VVICDIITGVAKVLLESIVSVFHLYEAVGPCENSIAIFLFKLCHNPKDHNLKVHLNQNFIFEIFSNQYKTRF
jgi:hypothetical protein